MAGGNGQLMTVPPGFRFHPTDEELLYYYLRKKVSYKPIDLDVIREVDLNKLEPWDFKDKCRTVSGPENEWYFFSHKDKKYPTGTRTNRATTAGFWKATGRDKAIHLSDSISTRIGMRKTLVFYTGRAPHGQKTDWIMHEYRLDDDNSDFQEEGWVVCKVFKKKNQSRGFLQEAITDQKEDDEHFYHTKVVEDAGPSFSPLLLHDPKQTHQMQQQLTLNYIYDHNKNNNVNNSSGNNMEAYNSMHLPQLFSPESVAHPTPTCCFLSSLSNNNPCMDVECSQNDLLMRLASSSSSSGILLPQPPPERLSGDWSFLDKLLASHSHHNIDHRSQLYQSKLHHHHLSSLQLLADANDVASSTPQRFPFPYLACQNDSLKFSK